MKKELIKVSAGAGALFYFHTMKDVGAFLTALDKCVRTESETSDITVSRVAPTEPLWHKLDWHVQSHFDYSFDKWAEAGCPDTVPENLDEAEEAA